MCGIAGILSNKGIATSDLQRMTNCIAHRGPDDEGYVLFQSLQHAKIAGGADTPPEVFNSSLAHTPKIHLDELHEDNLLLALAHRRLSIVDLSPAGHQPMSYRNRFWITYNGEVYNYHELRCILEQLGHHFASNTDTEVILAAYAEWGDECLCRLNGMFAFGLYDQQKQTLLLARDRFGIKPLYYWNSPAGFLAFASEIKQFSRLPGWHPALEGQRAYDFLAFGLTDHTENTLFQDVFQLPPGHSVVLGAHSFNICETSGRLPSRPWYTLRPGDFCGNYSDAVKEFATLFGDAVKLRTKAEVPVGSCLSGGLDSSAIVCTVSNILKNSNHQICHKTFSACSDDARFDERQWIDLVVAATGVDAHYVTPQPEQLFADLPALIRLQDEPFGSTSIYAQWKVFELAARHNVKVMLDGQGSDEQLAGYHGFFAPYLATLARDGRWIQLIREIKLLKQIHNYSHASTIKHLASNLLTGPAGILLRRHLGHTEVIPSWLDMSRLSALPRNPLLSDTGSPDSSLQKMSLRQLTSTNLQMLLHWEDRNSMGHSVESRVPFLDYRLVEFTLSLPDNFKLLESVTKIILRDAMHGILPEAIRTRTDKMGFVTPEEHWLRNATPQLFRREFAGALEASAGILKSTNAAGLLEGMIAGNIPFSFVPWRIICFGKWLETFHIKI